MLRTILASLVLAVLPMGEAFALDAGYWVIVGNRPQDEVNPRARQRIFDRVGRCGFEPFNDFSFKFGFRPGYTSYVLGAYATRAEAQAVLEAVRPCVPDAYIKEGAYSGE